MTTTRTPLQPSAPPRVHGDAWLAETLGRLLAHVRTLLPVDGAVFLMVAGEPPMVEPLAEWFASPDLRAAVAPPGGRPYDRARPDIAEMVLERGRALLLPRVDAWEAAPRLREAAMIAHGEDRAAEVWEAYRSASVIACPVKTTVGRTLGVLVVTALEETGSLGPAELRTVEVLADLAALALERAELLDREGHRGREELMLKRAAEDISGSLELDEVYRRVIRHALTTTGATKAAIARVNARAGDLDVVASLEFSSDFIRRKHNFRTGMLGSVARSRKPYLSRAADAESWDRSAMDSELIGSFMHVPIELGPRLFGVLTVAHQAVDRFGESELERLTTLARSSAAAIANAIDFERERRIARALTVGFVPEPLPEVAGYDAGVLYVPAANEPTGGDVYGAWRLPGGEVAMLVGDVAGKGVETAALSSMVRFFIEARSWDSKGPAAVLAETNAMLHGRIPRDTFVTAFFALLSPGRLRYCNAGHLPPLLVRGDSATPLPAHGLPLGIELEIDCAETDVELRSGDLVFTYTDGLMEARREGEMYGPERLTEFVRKIGPLLSPQELVAKVHREVAGWAGGLSDDAVALALRRRG
jgi:GAF domain-containing protein